MHTSISERGQRDDHHGDGGHYQRGQHHVCAPSTEQRAGAQAERAHTSRRPSKARPSVTLIGELEVAAVRHTAGDARDAYARTAQHLRQVQCSGLAIDAERRGHDHLLDAVAADAIDQRLHRQAVGADAIERGQQRVQHVVAAPEARAALDGDQILDAGHHAQHVRIAPLVATDVAAGVAAKVAAQLTALDPLVQVVERLGQRIGVAGVDRQDVEGQPCRAALADAWQARQQLHELGDGTLGHERTYLPARERRRANARECRAP